MKQRLVVFLGLLLSSVVVSVFISNQPVAALDNFVVNNYLVDVELGRDENNRSTLTTTETITVDFQQRNENHGLERPFVKTYKGHSTNHTLISVTDENGKTLPHHWDGDALRIGDKDEYVYGLQTYVITFTERDVTAHYADTNKDEFYWDVIGLDWRVPIERASLTLTITPELRSAIETDLQCYFGRQGATNRCEVNGSDGVYTASVENIGNRSGMTIALGFKPGTFAVYTPSLFERLFMLWVFVQIFATIAGVIAIIWLSAKAYRWTYRESELGTIVPEYIPPKNASVAVSASVSPGVHATLAAELTDLAVRHYIQIIETKEKSFWRTAEYDIKVIKDVSTLRVEEREILSDMFGDTPKVGDRLPMKSLRNSNSVYTRFYDNSKKIEESLKNEYGFKEKDETKRAWFAKAATILLFFAVITLSFILLMAAITAFVISKTLWVLSDEGLALRRYLKGLELYIKVAETERLKMLQSPEGAEKVDIGDPNDPGQLVKLYERVLPYAVLFGQEKEWSKQLGEYYQNSGTSPDWYSGNAAFNAVAFSSMMSSFSSSVATTSASSSSSGGSGGGGSSGGGGGGGGGGGW